SPSAALWPERVSSEPSPSILRRWRRSSSSAMAASDGRSCTTSGIAWVSKPASGSVAPAALRKVPSNQQASAVAVRRYGAPSAPRVDRIRLRSVSSQLVAPMVRPGWWTRLLGDQGERLAVRHLRRLGYRIVARQSRSRIGEIDVVAMDGDTIVFVEVK